MTHDMARSWLAAGCFSALFCIVALGAALGWLQPLDRIITTGAHSHLPCWALYGGDVASIMLSGEISLLYAGMLGILSLWWRRPFLGILVFGMLLLITLIEFFCKTHVHQPAPVAILGNANRSDCHPLEYPLKQVAVAYSFPSGYAARGAYFAVTASAIFRLRWRDSERVYFVALAIFAVALSATRVLILWHWTTDVVAGLLLGCAGGYVIHAFATASENPT